MPFLALHVSHRFFSFITNVGAQVRLYGRRNVVFSFAHYSFFFPPPLSFASFLCLFWTFTRIYFCIHSFFAAPPHLRSAQRLRDAHRKKCLRHGRSKRASVREAKRTDKEKTWNEKKKNEDYDGHVSLRVKALGSPVQSVRRRPCPLLTSRRLLALFLKKKERFCVYAVSLLLPSTFRPP